MHAQLGQIMDKKIQKTKKNPLLPILKSLEQKQGVGSKSSVLSMPVALNTSRGVGRPPQPRLWPDPWTHPYPHPIQGTSSRTLGGASKQGNLLFVLAPRCCSRGPNKALPAFVVWPLVNFY